MSFYRCESCEQQKDNDKSLCVVVGSILICEPCASRITVDHVNPPVPFRTSDYCAFRDPEGLYGWGSTSEEAMSNLLELESAQ